MHICSSTTSVLPVISICYMNMFTSMKDVVYSTCQHVQREVTFSENDVKK